MKRMLAAFVAGALFGIGLAVSRMTDPTVVLGFLDVAGAWDPTLAFVMGGAVLTTLVAFRWVIARDKPLFDDTFQLPTRSQLDAPLLVGSALFGIGWGLAGYCPGPVLVAAAAGVHTAWVFVPAMIVGGLLHRVWQTATPESKPGSESSL